MSDVSKYAVVITQGEAEYLLNEGDSKTIEQRVYSKNILVTFNSAGYFSYNGIVTAGKDGKTHKINCAYKKLATDIVFTAGEYGGKVRKVERTASDGNIDTYTITLDNGNTSTFTVTNEGGGTSIESIEKTSTDGLVDTYTITLTDGNTHTFEVTNGSNGVGIADIAKTGVDGLVDTYTITLTDGNTYSFTVTNGNTTIVDSDGSFDIADIVEQVLASLPEAEEVSF